MSASARMLAERAVGQYPLSVATSLALESACGIHPEIKVSSPPIRDYQFLWINLRTLYRNLMGALDHEAQGLVTDLTIAEALQSEMDVIEKIIEDVSSYTKIVFYVSNYKGLEQKYPHAVIRRDTTDRQKHYTALQTSVIKILLDMDRRGTNGDGHRIAVFDLKLKPKHHGKTLLLSHFPYDLCSAKDFGELVLLESHTGAIKESAQWYTKFLNGKDLPMIPFREDMLQIFGDNETFRPGDIHLRKDLIEIATRYRWTAVSTRDKILYGIEQLKNPFFKSVVRSMLV